MKVLFILTTVLSLTSCANDNHEAILSDKLKCEKHIILSKEKIVSDNEIPTTTTVFTVSKVRTVSTLKEDGEHHEYEDTTVCKYAVNDFGIDTIQ
jgi:hypothetical protein